MVNECEKILPWLVVNKCVKILPWLLATFRRSFSLACSSFGMLPESSVFQMQLRSATKVTRSITGTSCSSGVPWHALAAFRSFHSCSSGCSLPSSMICVGFRNHPAGDNSNYWQRTFAQEQFLVKYRSKASWSKNSLISPLTLHPQIPLLSAKLALNSSFSSKPSKEGSPKPGIIAR